MNHSSRAIVLSVDSFGEADRYVRFLTQKWGVISTLAKSARKSKRRYVGGLDLFCHDEISLRGDPKERPYLQELTVLNSFQGIRDHLERLFAAGKIIQWIRKLADVPVPMPGIYSITGQTLALIERETHAGRLEVLTLIFKLKLLDQLGLKPQMQSCVRCEESVDASVLFDMSAGGIICRNCVGKTPGGGALENLTLFPDDRQWLQSAEELKLSQWPEYTFPIEKVAPLSRIVTQFASFHTHAKLPV